MAVGLKTPWGVCNASGFADAAVVIGVVGDKRRDIDDLFSCSHNLL